MGNNKRAGMELKSIWFKKGEFKKLIHALEGNFSDQIVDIIYDIYKRGDLLE